MKKKFKLTNDTIKVYGRTLYRIEATEDIPSQKVKKGDLGGFVESADNLDENAWVSGEARVYGAAQVSGEAWVYGEAQVYGKARVGMSDLQFGKFESDDSKITAELVLCGSNLHTQPDGSVTGYKRVFKTDDPNVYESCYDRTFRYVRGEDAVAIDASEDMNESCAAGLHVSHPTYWSEGDTTIQLSFKLEDVLAVREGKVRVRKLKVI